MEQRVSGHRGGASHLTTSQSGVTFHEAQVALAKVYVGSDDVRGDTDEVVNIEKPHDQTTKVDQIGKKDTVEKAVKLPPTIAKVCIEILMIRLTDQIGERDHRAIPERT